MNTLSSIATRKIFPYFFTACVLLQIAGCRYYKITPVSFDEFRTIAEFGKLQKTFYLHYEDEVFLMKNIKVNDQTIDGSFSVQTDPPEYTRVDNNKQPRFHSRKQNWTELIQEVHLYIFDPDVTINLASGSIPVKSIHTIKVIDKNSGKSIAVFAATVGAVIGVPALIAALTSCPFIYTYDGVVYNLEGEIFGGAVLPNLERHDYLPLPSLRAQGDQYRIRISNELKEHQYLDLAHLASVNHPKGTQVLLDKTGKPHLIDHSQLPRQAYSADRQDLLEAISQKDSVRFFFNDEGRDLNEALLTFQKPADAQAAKLVIRAKNTLWADYLFGEFLKKFGREYNFWMNQFRKQTPEEREKIVVDNHYPLSVYLKQQGEWKLVDYLYNVGPIADRDLIIPIDLNDLEGPEVEIKLQTGFMFWELDYAAMDFSGDGSLEVVVQKPTQVVSSDQKNWLAALEDEDGIYMEQKEIDHLAELSFNVPPIGQDQVQSVFLHAKGYYEIIRDYTSPADWRALWKFRKAGYAMQYSRSEFLKLKAGEGMVSSTSPNSMD